jgi:hypothetical protein
MAKIKAAGRRKPVRGPKAPGAIGCITIVILLFVLLGILLYYSISRG